ncbi:cutinase family protein [Williamsia sp. 1135]|uniref:cutinase family protein n=1 Tax=Williamsia sp. 1135 TaxID=1889262 RepID=UPI000A0FE0EF|nr:cutinase family protein [Williamsia sp. 1135]ORM34760.1 cutinase [Williamsia sp. 1135]
MSAKKRSKGRLLLLAILGLGILSIIAIILVVILIINLFKPEPAGPTGPSGSSTTSSAPRPTAQPADCPDVQVIVVPGTWESASDDDPYNPTSNPNSLMLKVSAPLANEFDTSRADVYTVPYVAQFKNPTNLADRQVDYNTSRAEGTNATRAKIAEVNQRCPLTGFVLTGFSQGAVIAGDIAGEIGNGRGPVSQDLVLGVGLIADGRRQPNQVGNAGPNPPGVGAEIALDILPIPGIDLTGPRPGGFGELTDRAYSLCAPGDLICDAPTIANPVEGLTKLMGAINNPVHAMYNTTRYWSDNGEPATVWMTDWARGVIDQAPFPKHE